MPNARVKTETIDGVVLRLLGIAPGAEMDYEIYFNLLKKRLANARLTGKGFSPEEDQLLRAELKKAQKQKASGGRFRAKQGRARVTSTPRSTPRTSRSTPRPSRPSQKLLTAKGQLVKAPSNKITAKNIKPIEPANVRDVTPKHPFSDLRAPLDSIFGILQSRFKFDKKQQEEKRKEDETKKRGKRESSLEGFKKGIVEIVSATKKMLAPFEEVINRITRFIFFTLLGRAFTGFMEWMKDKGNQEKFNSFVEFLSKHWPALAGLYILFGTSLGKLARGIVKLAARMIVALAVNIPKIFAFIRKNKKLALLGAAAASYASGRVGELFKSKEPKEAADIKPNADLATAGADIERAKATPAPKLNQFNLGGIIPKFASGGINPFGGMNFGDGIPIQGAGKDDTLIAAKTGEAILTEKDQVDLSQRYVDKETGQPLNIPQYLAGRKPGQVAFGKLRFPTLGGGFFNGGMVSQFNKGGIIGGAQNLINSIGSFFSGKTDKPNKPNKPNKPIKLQDFELPEAQALLRTIRSAEHYTKTKNPYNALFGGGSAPIDKMTVKEVIDMYSTRRLPPRLGGTPVKYGSGSGAAGAYQFMPFTLEDLIRRGEVKPDQIMTRRLQDKLGWALARNRGVSINALRQSGLSQSILDKIAPEWASLPYSGSGGQSFYGQPVKSIDFLQGVFKGGIKKKQGGGLVELPSNNIPMKPRLLGLGGRGGGTDAITKQDIAEPLPERLRRMLFGISKPSYDPQEYFKGGIIKENTGIKNPLSAADRRLVAVQPEEFVVTAPATRAPGVLLALENLNRVFDSNSAASLGRGSVRLPSITPYNTQSSSGNIMQLPPIMAGSNGTRARASGYGGGSQVPSFSAVAPNNRRAEIAEMYELVG